MLKVTVAVTDPEVDPVAVIVRVAPDVAVGVPEMTPVDEEIVNPVGNVPTVTAYVTVPTNPTVVKVEDGVIAAPVLPVID